MNREEMITDLRAKIIIGKKIFSNSHPETVKSGGQSYLILELLDEDERDAQIMRAYKDGYLEGVRDTIQRHNDMMGGSK